VRRFTWLFVASMGLLASCRGSEPSAPLALSPDQARREMLFDCQMNSEKCSAIRMGILALQLSTNQVCKNIGNAAYNRYAAPAGSGQGFRDGTDPGDPTDQAYVWMTNGQSYSGMVPADGWIYFTPTFWNSGYNSSQMAGIIAHEEGGHQTGADDIHHNTGVGYSLEAQCTAES
jgi:hypothetical protein